MTESHFPPVRCYAFGPFLADFKKRQLWQGSHVISLNHKTFEVLAVLIEHRDRVVEKDEFFRLVWPDAVVLESNLVRQISMLRRALGQRHDQHDYILTIPGSGYQFVADVTESACPPSADDHPPVPEAASVTAIEPVAGPAAAPWHRPAAIAVASVALLGVAGLVTMGVLRSRPDNDAGKRRLLHQFSFDAGLPREPSWSPDGSRIAYTSDRAGNPDIWVQSVADPDPVRITTSPAKDSQPSWSPDGQWIAYRSEQDGGGIYVVAPSGGEPRRVAAFGDRPRWSPNGSQILLSESTVNGQTRALFVADLSGAAPRRILESLIADFLPGAGSSINAAWHPNGSVSIWARHPRTGWTFVTAPIDGGPAVVSAIPDNVQQQLQGDLALGRFIWARSSRAIYFEGDSANTRSVWRVSVDPASLAWQSEAERLTTSAAKDGDLALSVDGSRLAFTVRTTETRAWSLPLTPAGLVDASLSAPISSGGADALDPDASFDGQRVSYSAMRGGRQELRVHAMDSGRDVLLLASTTTVRTTPRWSRDGKQLAYSVRRQGSGNQSVELGVGVMAADSGIERLHETGKSFIPADWSRDGITILGGCREPQGRISACLLNLTQSGAPNRGLTRVASDDAYNIFCVRFSPDERWISFLGTSATNPRSNRVYVQRPEGGPWLPLTDGTAYVDKPRWDRDGKTIYYIADRDGFLNVWGQHFDSAAGRIVGAPFQVTTFNSEQRLLPSKFGGMEMAVASGRLFLPIRETSASIWILDDVDR